MKKRLLASLLSLSMAATLLPTAAFAAAGEVNAANREELAAALADKSVSVINVTANISMGADYWTPAVIERDLTINGNGNVISGMKVNTGILKPSGSGIPGDGSSCDYYAGFIGNNKGALTINDLDFSGAVVDMDPLTVNKKSTGSSILAVVCANNSGALVYNDVDVAASEVRGYTKAALLHGFSQGKNASFTANRCSIVDSTVVVEADGTDPEASLNGMIVGYDGNNVAKTNGIKLKNNSVVIDKSVQSAGGINYDETTGLYTFSDGWIVFCETYAHGAQDTDAVFFTAEANGYLYETLADAVAATESGTVTLLKDELASPIIPISSGKNITVNMNGHNIAFNNRKFFQVIGGTLTLTGKGKIYEKTPFFSPVVMQGSTTDQADYSVVNVGKDITLEGWTGLFMDNNNGCGYGMVANVEGTLLGKIDSNDDYGSALYLNGSVAKDTGNVPKINILGTAKLEGDGASHGIYQAGFANTVIEPGASVTGISTGIEVRAGNLTVSGGTITGNGVPAFVTPNGNGTTSDGCGIAIAQHTTKLPITVTINDGTIRGFSALYESNPQKNTAEFISKVSVAVNGGKFAAINGGAVSVYSEDCTKFISGGLFSSDPSAYLASGKTVLKGDYTVDGISYGYKVGDPVIADAEVAVTDGETKAEAPSADKVTVPSDSKITPDSLQENAKGVTSDGLTAETTSQVETLLKDQTAEKAESALTGAGVNVNKEDTITIVAEPYLDIAVESYSETSKNASVVKELALDISAKYSVKATTASNPAEMTDSNTATISTGKTLHVDSPITISIPLPEGFVDSTNDVVYVRHKGYEYTATVTGDAVSGFTAEFVNPHGFSLFTASTTSAAEASIGSVNYTSVQDALRAVKDGETLKVLKSGLSGEVSGNKTFKLDGEKITLTPVAGYKMTIKNNTVTVWEEAYVPSAPGSVPSSKSGWVKSGNDWYFYKSGVKATGWIIDNGVRYYLHEDGKMATGWLKLDNAWYYFYKWGGMAENGWVLDNNVWYYLNADGKMATGWLFYRDNWYYLYRWGGMAVDWAFDNNVWYYLKDDGKMATGWIYDRGRWYYLRDWGGMISGRSLVIDGVTYNFAENGQMK